MYIDLCNVSKKIEELVARKLTIQITFVLYVLSTMLFLVTMHYWDFQIIDEMYDANEILAHIALLSSEQKHVHIALTATLDVVYPFVYGAFQAGMAYRYLGKLGRWVALLSIFCIPVDLIEGFSQVMLLLGNESFITLKTIVTPVKLSLFIPGLCFTLVAGCLVLYRKVTGPKNTKRTQ